MAEDLFDTKRLIFKHLYLTAAKKNLDRATLQQMLEKILPVEQAFNFCSKDSSKDFITSLSIFSGLFDKADSTV
jgi:hypothetical protein